MKKTTMLLAAMAVSSASFAQLWDETINGGGDAGELLGTAQVTMGVGMLSTITGHHTPGDADMFAIWISDPNLFFAQTIGNGTTLDTQLFLFTSTGMGVSFNDDAPSGTLQSQITDQFVNSTGLYYLAISQWDRDATGLGMEIWLDTPFNVERAPDGPGAANPIDGWTTGGNTDAAYQIDLRGAEYATVPEPGTFVAIGLGLAGLALARRRK